MRGEFDPGGDGVVSGYRVERGEGRSAEEATGPQPSDYDDLFIAYVFVWRFLGPPMSGKTHIGAP